MIIKLEELEKSVNTMKHRLKARDETEKFLKDRGMGNRS